MTSGQPIEDAKIFAPDTIIGETEIKKYRIIKQINAGGEAIIYKAEPLGGGHVVALKLHYKLQDPVELKRFKRVRDILQIVKGPNILPLEDAGIHTDTDGNFPYFVFPFISGGRTLEHIIQEYRQMMPLNRVNNGTCVPCHELLNIAIAAGSGLRDAHHRGVQHRDFKPANVLISEGGGHMVVRVMDFGIARLFGKGAEKHTKLTMQGFFRGTPEYLSPEQARGLEPDEKGDIWAFGVVLYEMITGVLPFDFEDEHRLTVLARVTTGAVKPTPVETYCQNVDQRLVDLAMHCMEFDAKDRPENMDAVLDELNRMQLRLPQVSMSDIPPPIISVGSSVSPDALTLAAPSTPPKALSVEESKVVVPRLKTPASFAKIELVNIPKSSKRAADKKTKPAGRKLDDGGSWGVIWLLVALFLVAGGMYYMRFAWLPLIKSTAVKNDEDKTSNENTPAINMSISSHSAQATASAPSMVPSFDTEPAPASNPSASAPPKSTQSARAEPQPRAPNSAKPRSSGYKNLPTVPQPIPGVDYIPGIDGL